MKTLEERVAAIEARNHRVELDQAWEVSSFRKLLILILTFLVIFGYEIFRGSNEPLANALAAVVGFYVSTLAFNLVKRWWIRREDAR